MTGLDGGEIDGKVANDAGSHGRESSERVTYYVWFITGMISISGLLFGLDTGIICEMSSWKR